MNPNSLRKASGHSYTVEVRFCGDDLDPDEITRRIGLTPSSSLSRLAATAAHKPRRPFWAYNGCGEEGFFAEWESLEDGLAFVAQRLAPVQSTVVELSQAFEGMWWCGHFQSSFDGGPRLSPRILSQIAAFGLPLLIDNYFATDE